MTTVPSDIRQHLAPQSTPPLPLAVGILGLPDAATEEDRRTARLDLALDVYKLGYFAVDILDITPDADTSGYTWARTLAERTDADAFVCAGSICSEQLASITDGVRVIVRDAVALTGPARTAR